MKAPNFFIVGAAKSGTTTLWHCLKKNPQVFLPGEMLLKEPAYFSHLKNTRFKKWEDYINLFAGSSEINRWIGEASTAYLTDPVSAGRIYEYNPGTRIIIILRNPVSRAYSLYNWMVQEGYEYADSFEKALLLEEDRKRKKIPNFYEPEYYYNFLYFNSGLYYEQVKRYKELFKRNVLILKFENFTTNLRIEYKKICEFLDIQPNPIDYIDNVQKNESRAAISPVLQFLLRKITRFFLLNKDELDTIKNDKDEFKKKIFDQLSKDIVTLKKVAPIGFTRKFEIYHVVKKIAHKFYRDGLEINWDSKETRDSLLKYGVKNSPPKKLKKKTALILKEKYRTDILKLSEHTNVDFSDWII